MSDEDFLTRMKWYSRMGRFIGMKNTINDIRGLELGTKERYVLGSHNRRIQETTEKNWEGLSSKYINLEYLDHVNENVIRFSEITHKMLELYSRKNRDYGNSFDDSLDEDGILVSKIRLGDKFSRFTNIIKNGEVLVDDESIEDTLLDMANYAIMTVMWMEKERNKITEDSEKMFVDGQEVGPFETREK